VVGSGIAAERLSPGDVGVQLLENSLITGAVLVALILALQPVSAAFNPVVTLVEPALGAISTTAAAVLIAAQVFGGVLGAVVANLMFDLPAVTLSTQERTGGGSGSARWSPPWAWMFSDSFAGIAGSSVAMFVLMQLVGGALAFGLVRLLHPDAPAVAAEVTAGVEDHPTTRNPR